MRRPVSMAAVPRLVIALMCVLLSAAVSAHKPSDSFLRIGSGAAQLEAEWDMSLRDLEVAVGLDTNADGEITWGELSARQREVFAYALSRLSMRADGLDCALRAAAMRVNRHSDGSYASLAIGSSCPADAAAIEVEYAALFDVDPTHRGLVRLGAGDAAGSVVLTRERRTATLETGEARPWRTVATYVVEGVWHIWIGFDHILFLLALLLPAVLAPAGRRWVPVPAAGPALRQVLKVVTLFTLAHTITLWLAVMEYVTLPAALVEAAIAATIVVTAAHNLRPIWPRFAEFTAFGFGLVHGFGFANVLVDLGLSASALALSLLAFNVGVELGQLAIVALLAPIVFASRATIFYRVGVLRFGSVLVMLVATAWFAERAFDVELLPV